MVSYRSVARVLAAFIPVLLLFCTPALSQPAADAEWESIPTGDAAHGTREYSDFESSNACAPCHVDIYQQWTRSMMSKAYTHSWDEIEYFKLAVPHAERKEKVAGVKAGCNGCHAPIAFLAGDTPPPKPGSGGLADEAVSCDFCHSLVGFKGDTPYNFNWISNPGETKYGGRAGVESPYHEIQRNEFLESADFCGTCHNEMSPYGVWVKSTHLEWAEGPYAKQGVPCQDCHMPRGEGALSVTSDPVEDMRHHLFHGAHVASKVRGAIELVLWTDADESEPGETVKVSLALFNQKAGHKIPTGSAEERQLWVTLEAVDSQGNRYHLPVDRKGFEGEEQTITSNELAYQDLGEPLDDPTFAGLPRDATEYEGDRIFCLPYFDEQGRRTVQQWNTASLGVDYRIGPRQTRIETYTWNLPDDLPLGELRFEATLNYRLLVKSVGDFLGVPEKETTTFVVNTGVTSMEIVD